MVKRISIGLCWVLLAPRPKRQGRMKAMLPDQLKRLPFWGTEAFGYIGNYDRLNLWARSRCAKITVFLKEDCHV